MPSRSQKRSAAEESKPKPNHRKKRAEENARTNRPKDAVKSKAGKASAAARKAKREKGDPITRQCSARRTNGEPCKNSAIRGGTVCSRHGGSAPQVKAKANQRLIEMVLPAMRELRKVLDSKTASDADKLKAVNMVLQRTGFNERHHIDIGLREPNAWDRLSSPDGPAFVIARGEENVIDSSDERPALGGVGDENSPEALNRHARLNGNRGDADAATYLPGNDDADIVVGRVLKDVPVNDDFDPLGALERERRESRRHSQFGGGLGEKPEDPWAAYETKVREAVERDGGR